MKVIIIDDEPLARMVIREYIESYPDIEVICECDNGFEGLKAIHQYSPDLVFLDIQMPKINGFEMLELVDSPPPVIFTTAFDEYAIKAFESNAVDYLLKPFSKSRFDNALQRYLVRTPGIETQPVLDSAAVSPTQQNRIIVKDGSKIKIIPVSQVHYIQAADDYVKIHTAEGGFLKNRTMGFFEESLSAFQFVRIHRSYIVNTQLITRIDPYEKEGHLVRLNTGDSLPVSKTGYAKLKIALGI